MKKLTCIDLFAGAGGLSYGFLETNQFNIKLAIENNKHAQETYKKNHSNADIEGDINNVSFSTFKKLYGDIDVIIGGPPCQGFSNANRQHNYLISPQNQLIKKYIEAVKVINPKIVVLENVKTIDSNKHKFLLTNTDDNMLSELQLKLYDEEIFLGDATFLSEDYLIFLNQIKLSESLISHLLPDNIYILLNQLSKKVVEFYSFANYFSKHKTRIRNVFDHWDLSNNQYWCDEIQIITQTIKNITSEENINTIFATLKTHLPIIIDTQKTLKKILDIQTYDVYHEDFELSNDKIILRTKSYKIIEYIIQNLKHLGYSIDYNVLNAAEFGVPQLRRRFILLGIKKEYANKKVTLPSPQILDSTNYFTIADAIQDLEYYDPYIDLDKYQPICKKNNISPINLLLKELSNSCLIHNHIITNSREDALNRFQALKPGQNFHDLSDELKSTYTEPSKTQNTIYKRLQYNTPSDTVVNVRKSMWIHPTKDRAISIREAARLQSFPDSFIFYGTKDAQYQQIGNAVPPLLGKAIAEKILDIIS